MPRTIQQTESERKSILALHKKVSHREIPRKINRSNTVVTHFLQDPLKYGSGKQTGRRKKSINVPNALLLELIVTNQYLARIL